MRAIALPIGLTAMVTASVAIGQQQRQLDSHEHGQGLLNIAFEGKVVAMELEVPGADIVGFEHPATSAADRASIEEAKAKLTDAETLFILPDSAGCDLERARADLIGSDNHDDGHDDHGEGGTHTEFVAVYQFGCADPDEISNIRFPYFKAFPNAERLQIQMIKRGSSGGFNVSRSRPVLQF